MPALAPEILTRLRAALTRCTQLRDDTTLRALFTDDRIAPWANELPNALRASDRVAFVVDTLGDRSHADYGENALVLFIHALRDTVDARDTLHAELDVLARDLTGFPKSVRSEHSTSEELTSLTRQLSRANRALHILEEDAAGFGALHIPVDLQIELEEQREKVAGLEARLDALQSGNDADALPNLLPRRESFFGREKEIAKAMEALSPTDRSWGLVIDGIGGIGKTALAVEVAYLCQEQGRFEVFLFATAKTTRLEPSGERDLPDNTPALDALLNTLAHALGATGVAQSAGAEKRRGLLTLLRGYAGPVRRVLVILDNLETLPPEEQLAATEWMRALPAHCKGIITSRRRAGDGAVWLRLERLEWNAARALIAEEIRRSTALERLLTPAGEPRWQKLYDATGGSPLALRWLLGLMQARALPIERAVALLRGAGADDQADTPLHQFIYREARQEMGADDWQLLGALALFAAPASFAALTATTGLSRLALESAVERLNAYALVDVLGPDGPYTLHPLTRTLALAELKHQPDGGAALRRAFGRYWVDYAKKYGGYDKDAHQTYDHLEVEWTNLDTAASELYALTGLPNILIDDTAARLLIELVNALSCFLWYRGYWDERIRLNEWGYVTALVCEDWSAAAWRAFDITRIYQNRAIIDLAVVWGNHCIEACKHCNSPNELAIGVRLSGMIARLQGNYIEAEQFLHAALTAYRDLGAVVEQSVVLNSIGVAAWERKDYDYAAAYFREALVLAEKCNNKATQATCLSYLGQIALESNDSAVAHSFLECALPLSREVGREDRIASVLWGLARVLEEKSRPSEALPLAEESLLIRERLQHRDTEESRELVARLREKVDG